MSAGLPEGLLLAYYGDDFTGSTDTMEVMALKGGLPTVLFLTPPTPERLARFADRRGIGLAGIARAKSPAWMDAHLPGLLAPLFALGAPVTQYKVCSTFDSAPHVGSIGRAVDLALPRASETWSPMVVGAPQLRRWQAFGNLFAGVGDVRYRIDRHPTMSRHPVTPMREGDLSLHLAEQTRKRIAVIDLADLEAGGDAALARVRDAGAEIVMIDVADERSQIEAGRLIWENRGSGVFSASSSGLQYALVAYWRAAGLLPARLPDAPPIGPADRLLVVSGSCSPVTADQIRTAEARGFAGLRLDGIALADPARRDGEIARALAGAGRALDAGRHVVAYTAASPDDPAIAALAAACPGLGVTLDEAQERLGDALGIVASAMVRSRGLRRLVVAGGDTSGRVLAHLPIHAIEAASPLAAGSPLCRGYSDDPAFDGLELVMKGGQVGGPDLFVAATGGTARR
jgi:uncharacterized protein YgbK (DUF1537 family)